MRLTDSNGAQDDITIVAGANITIDQIGSNGFRILSTASGGGGATVTTDDSAPPIHKMETFGGSLMKVD